MTISKRLLLLIAAAVFGLTLTAGSGVYLIDKVYTAASVNTVYGMPSMQDLGKANDALAQVRLGLWRHIANGTIGKKKAVETEISAQLKAFDKALRNYEQKDISGRQERALLANDRAEMAKFRSVLDHILMLSRASRQGEALALAAAEPARTVAEALHAHLQYSVELGKQADQEAQAAKARSLSLAAGIAVLTSVAVFLLGLSIYSQIRSGLRRAQQTIVSIGSSLDFTQRAPVQGQDEIAQMLRAFNHLIERLQANLLTMQAGVSEVAETAGVLLGAARRVAESSVSQSESSSHMAASVEQMSVSIAQVVGQASEASQLAGEAGGKAQSGRVVIDQTVGDIHTIAAAAEAVAGVLLTLEANGREIAMVVNVVGEVADQTNLLALNAAIEAARAGEAGRGFAVVADEVRQLAERTTDSTREIAAKISAIQTASGTAAERMREAMQRVEQGVARAGLAIQAMEDITAASNRSERLAGAISGAIREQGDATHAIAEQVEKVARMTEENSRASGQAAAMAQKLEEISTHMRAIVAAYRL